MYLLAVYLFIIVVVSLCGCGNKNASSKIQLNESADTSDAQTVQPSLNADSKDKNASSENPTSTREVSLPQKNVSLIEAKNSGNYTVVIDAGHQRQGNSELEPIAPESTQTKPKVSQETTGISTKEPEYKVTLQVSVKLRNLLKQKGYNVIMCRESHDVNISNYVAKRYLINSDGTLQAVNPAYSTTAVTTQELINNKIIGDELTDLSVLEIDESLKINHTDMIGLIIDMVNTLIQVITYALIAFTALSLVVSTVMIGIITYVSVVERIKEIGVIISLGGRKKDVSHLFNAETLIIGTAAGLLGIGITYLLSLIINLIVGHFSGIYTIASLPWYEAVIMVVLSIVLTLISGLIPARSAARKDPVVALRTE